MTMTPDGFYDRYQVFDKETGDEITGVVKVVLLPESDPHAAAAIHAYADSVNADNERLAADMHRLAADTKPA